MTIVIENLKAAIKGESKAKKKYELFAEKAEQENLPIIAKLFKAISSAEGIHIKNHLKALLVLTKSKTNKNDFVIIDEKELQSQVKDTASNLKNAIAGEMYETKKMYKKFVKNSTSKGFEVAELSFQLARKAEKVHAKIYSQYLKKLEKSQKIEDREIYVCQICGNIEFNDPPSVCSICDHTKRFFKKVT
ncbi:MAG: rubrerythrin family protein [Promethearchaeota archaeon]